MTDDVTEKSMISLRSTYGAMKLTIDDLYDKVSSLMSLVSKTEFQFGVLEKMFRDVGFQVGPSSPPTHVSVTPSTQHFYSRFRFR
ncbi:unnamed protein product [Linum trigynum]|uniref:Uncharacterized protein n=1 Tax=Linum trigynum TaxID=586398 RepID=A0AAV2DAZ7_9ROSI